MPDFSSRRADPAYLPPTPTHHVAPTLDYIEGVCEEYAAIIVEATVENMAPNWTLDLIAGGVEPDHLREMGLRWTEWNYEPVDFPARLEALATAVEDHRSEGMM